MIKGGPKVVTDGLVLCLDAHDAKSYAGEPVTNLASGSFYTWVNSGAWTQNTYTTHESSPVGFPPGLKGVSGVQVIEGICTTAGSIHFGTGQVNPASASTQYTYSVWFYQKNRAGIGGPYARANVSNSNLGTMKYNGTTGSSNWPVNKWIKLEITFTTQSSDTLTYISNYIGSQVGDTMYFCAAQCEQKSYYSPYANSSRSATDAWVDRSGNSNSGTLTNMIGTGVTHYRDGQVIMPVANSYLEFDGSNDYINLTSHSSAFDFGTGNFSVEAWVNGAVNNNYRCIFWHHYNPGFTLITTYGQSPNGAPRFWLGGTVLNGTTSILDGTWHHVLVTRNGADVNIYVDGSQNNSSSAFSGKSATVSTAQAAIGQYNVTSSSYPFDGKIAVVRVYNKALTAAEVLSNYNATKGRFS